MNQQQQFYLKDSTQRISSHNNGKAIFGVVTITLMVMIQRARPIDQEDDSRFPNKVAETPK
jgi:hypothetical protein